MIDWLYGRRNENISRMAENTVIDYANGLAMEARLRQHDDTHMIRIGNLLDQLYSVSQRNRYSTAQNYISRLITEYNNQMEGNMTTTKNKLRFGESIEIHDELNPAIWTENKELKPEVEDKIEDIVDTFVEMLKERDIDIKVEDIYLLGSNANYNCSKCRSHYECNLSRKLSKKDNHIYKITRLAEILYNNLNNGYWASLVEN